MGSQIHMEVEAVQTANTQISTFQQDASTELQTLGTAVDQLFPAQWKAPAADQWKQQWDEWFTKQRTNTEALQELMWLD